MKKQHQSDDRKWIVDTQADVAREFGVERSTVSAWMQKGMPGRKGAFNLSAITQWLFTLGPWRSEVARDDILRNHIEG